VMCFFVGTSTCIQIFVAQHYGAQDNHECGKWAWQGLYAIMPLAAAVSLILYFGAASLMLWLEPDPAIAPHAVSYLRARTFGSVGLIGAVTLSSFFRGLGDTRTPLYATVAANLLNAALDYCLIFGEFGFPAWGVRGAGVATSIAEWANFFFLALLFGQRRLAVEYHTRIVAPSRQHIRRLMHTGLPVGAQWWLEMTSFAAFLTLVARMGDAPMAASQAFVALLSISFMQAQGLAIAVSTLVGQYIGARDLEAAERSFWSGVRLCLIFAGGIAAIFVLLPEPLLRIFSKDPRVIELGVPLMWIGAVFQVFDAMAIIADGGLRGAGDTRWPMMARFILAWGVFLPTAYVFGIVLGGGLTGAWAGGLIYGAALTVLLIGRFRSGRWQQIKI
jgi:MATE family multidrug resistance protein